MDFATHDVQQGREETRAALTEKIEMLEQRVRDSVEDAAAAVKRTVDVDYQINHHPWRMFGLSLFFGYVAGCFRRASRQKIALPKNSFMPSRGPSIPTRARYR